VCGALQRRHGGAKDVEEHCCDVGVVLLRAALKPSSRFSAPSKNSCIFRPVESRGFVIQDNQ